MEGVTFQIEAKETLPRQHRSAKLALFRALLAVAYLASEAMTSRVMGRAATAVDLVFVAYSVCLLLRDTRPLSPSFSQVILFLDLLFLLSLVFWAGSPSSAAVAGAFFAFLVLESWPTQGGREVILLASALTLVVYGARVERGEIPPLMITAHSLLFLLVVGGILTFLFSEQIYPAERRILAIASKTAGASESDTVAAIEEGLKELAAWYRCSHAFLAFWDQRHDHYCLCRYPANEDPSQAGAAAHRLDDSREWSVLVGERLNFLVSDIQPMGSGDGGRLGSFHSETPDSGDPGYDLHPHLIRKFQIHNAIGCGLYYQDKAIGRLLLINHVSAMRRSMVRRLRRVAPAFTELVRQLLVIKVVEHEAAERERTRVAQDFHDGPLQSVISFQMRVHTIRKLLDRDPEAAVRELEQLQDVARRQVTDMRTFVNSMRPVEVDTTSITAAARRLVDDFQKESGVPVTFISGDVPVSGSGRINVDILQIIREALHNIHKHAQATHVLFSLEKTDSDVLIAVNDNGKGFRFGGRYTLEELELLRLGPNSIKQRMRALGGDVVLESQPGHGANLRLRIPLY